jgi:hypothetical protein
LVLYVGGCDSVPADDKKSPDATKRAPAKGDGDAKPSAGEAKSPDAKAPPVAAGPDPCALVSRVRAGEALHSAVQDGVRSGNACKWKATTGPGSVVIEVTPTGGAAAFEREKKLLGPGEAVADLGTAAFQSGNIVGVHAGDRYVSIAVAPNIGQGPLAKPADAVLLAKDAIAALPD